MREDDDMVDIARIYDGPFADEAYVVLVDRLWPRGVSKEKADWDRWCKGAAPSNELRRRYHSDGDFESFAEDYRAELDDEPARSAVDELVATKHLLLVTSAKDLEHCHLPVLKKVIEERRRR